MTKLSANASHTLFIRSGKVMAWGTNSQKQCNIPSSVNHKKIISVATGLNYSVALDSSGILHTWGGNFLFCNPKVQKYPRHRDFKAIQISAKGFFTAVLLQNHEKKQKIVVLHRDSMQHDKKIALIPTRIQQNSILEVSVGLANITVLLEGGKVAVWGDNQFGQCNVPKNLNNIIAISTGGGTNNVLTCDGQVISWGLNNRGQCNVPKDLKDVVKISAGTGFCAALKSDGKVIVWGNPNKLISKTTSMPLDMSCPFKNKRFIDISSTPSRRIVALTADGAVVNWGDWEEYNWQDSQLTEINKTIKRAIFKVPSILQTTMPSYQEDNISSLLY